MAAVKKINLNANLRGAMFNGLFMHNYAKFIHIPCCTRVLCTQRAHDGLCVCARSGSFKLYSPRARHRELFFNLSEYSTCKRKKRQHLAKETLLFDRNRKMKKPHKIDCDSMNIFQRVSNLGQIHIINWAMNFSISRLLAHSLHYINFAIECNTRLLCTFSII